MLGVFSVRRDLLEGRLLLVDVAWTCNAAGDGTLDFNNLQAPRLSGILHRVEFEPSLAAAPTAGYDVTLDDQWGLDVLNGEGIGLSATTPAWAFPYNSLGTSGHAQQAIRGDHKLVIADAGNEKSGRLRLYLLVDSEEALAFARAGR